MFNRRYFSVVFIICLYACCCKGQSCDMLDSIMTDLEGKLFDKYYACLNENSMHTSDLDMNLVCKSMKSYFTNEEMGKILTQIDSPSQVATNLNCKSYFAKIVSKDKARRIYTKAASRSELYTLKHSKETYAVYFFSTPIYIRDYAIINWIEKAQYEWSYYKVLVLKRSGVGWKVIDALDGGMTKRHQIR